MDAFRKTKPIGPFLLHFDVISDCTKWTIWRNETLVFFSATFSPLPAKMGMTVKLYVSSWWTWMPMDPCGLWRPQPKRFCGLFFFNKKKKSVGCLCFLQKMILVTVIIQNGRATLACWERRTTYICWLVGPLTSRRLFVWLRVAVNEIPPLRWCVSFVCYLKETKKKIVDIFLTQDADTFPAIQQKSAHDEGVVATMADSRRLAVEIKWPATWHGAEHFFSSFMNLRPSIKKKIEDL